MTGRVAGDVEALAAVPGALELGHDGLARAAGDLDEALAAYWARCPDFRPSWDRLGPDLGGHAARSRALGAQFGRVAGQLAQAGSVAPLEPVWRRPEDGLASLAAADAAVLERQRRLDLAERVAPRVTRLREETWAAGVSVELVAIGTSLVWRLVELADGTVEVTLLDREDVGLEVGGAWQGLRAGASLLVGEAQGWTKRFASRAEADGFVRANRAEALVEKGWANGAEALLTFGVPFVGHFAGAALGRRFDRGFDDADRTTTEVEGSLRVDLTPEGDDGSGGRLVLAARMTVSQDRLAGTSTDTLQVSSEGWGAIDALVGEGLLGEARSGELAGEASLAVAHDEAGRPLELRVTTVVSRDGGDTLERTVRSLDLTAPANAPLAAVLGDPSASPARRAEDLGRAAAALGAGLGSRYSWGVVVREGYRRTDEDGPDVSIDPGIGGSASVRTEGYEPTYRSVE